MKNYTKTISSIISYLLFAICCVILVESGARLYAWKKEGISFFERNPHPLLDIYEPHPYLISAPKPNGKWEQFSVNSMGFRGREFRFKKPNNVYRVIALGESTTWGYINDDEHTWPRELERYLNEKYDGAVKFEVINAGVPGYNSLESLINLTIRLLDLSPDMIIVYHAYNDLKANGYSQSGCDYSLHRQNEGQVSISFLERNFRLGYLLFDIDRLNKIRRILPRREGKFKRSDVVSSACVDAFKDNLRKMIRIAKAYKIEVILNTYAASMTEKNLQEHPEIFKPVWQFVPRLTYAGMSDGINRYNEAVRNLGRQENIKVIEQDRLIPNNFEYFYDHVHFTDLGNKQLAINAASAVWDVFSHSYRGE